MFFSVVVGGGGFVRASLLLLLLLVCLICWFVGLFMTCTLLKFELSVRVVLGTDFFLINSKVDSVMLFTLICPLVSCYA